MAGIYIHIPFCRKACHYCNFHFSTSLGLKNDFIEALLKEIVLQTTYLKEEIVETIYLGGGTPSLLTQEELQKILAQLYQYFTISNLVEITLEANPDDIDAAKLTGWQQAGINRLSIGVQSFFEEDLQWMNRAHNAQQAIDSIKLAKAAGFHNITIDLIFGTPTLTDEHWQQNVQLAVALDIPHLSCYALTVEPSTALQKMIEQHKTANVDAEKQAKHFEQLMHWLQQAGYEHYEISNFAKPGQRSQHNSSYWQQKKYLGLGPSAHSFNGISRQWNIANNALYIQSLQKNELQTEVEILTNTQRLNEYIMTSLRTIEGLNLGFITDNFGIAAAKRLEQLAKKYVIDGKVILVAGTLQLTNAGKLYADGIAADLFDEKK